MSDSEKDDGDEQVFIRFVTRLDDYRVPSEKIHVPKKLRRLGLSQLVNHLLGNQENPMPFDFLIKNTFLRTSLKSHIKKHHINEEDVIEVEYVFAISAPETVDSLPHEDWVSALDHHQYQNKTGVIISGSYDNVVRVWKSNKDDKPKSKSKPKVQNKDQERLLAEIKGHAGPIKALSSHVANDKVTLVSASQDQTLRVNTISVGEKVTVTHVSNLIGHTGSVDDCDISPEGQLIASAGWDHKIKLWQLPKDNAVDKYTILQGEDGDENDDEGSKRKKKRRIEPSDTPKTLEVNRRAVESFSEHTGAVSAVRFVSSEELVSASWDHSIKFWDIQSGVVTTNIVAKDVLNCINYNKEKELLLTGHADGTVRLWDRRAQHSEVATLYQSHSIWVSAVAFHPTRSDVFASVSYDQTLKLWDVRSKVPLSTISGQHEDKVLCAEWLDDQLLLSGSADKTLKAHLLK